MTLTFFILPPMAALVSRIKTRSSGLLEDIMSSVISNTTFKDFGVMQHVSVGMGIGRGVRGRSPLVRRPRPPPNQVSPFRVSVPA